MNEDKNKKMNFFTIFKEGDWITRLSYLIMGSGSFLRKQYVKGFIYLAAQIAYLYYLIVLGITQLTGLATLGINEQGQIFDQKQQIYIYSQGDNSMLFLIFGVMSLLMLVGYVTLYYSNIKSAFNNQKMIEDGESLTTIKEEIKALTNERFHVTVLTIPTVMTTVLTILPLIFMILIAFTNFDKNHQPPGSLFTWVGLSNFKSLLYANPILSSTFFNILKWTFVWAVFATFLNYMFGMLLAMIINKKGIKLKKMWRTIFIISVAVPQFVSLMLMSQLLHDLGPVNTFLQNAGIIAEPIGFLSNPNIVKYTVIVVNLWVGIPYTMLITSGILMNIPQDMYESAKLDGAGKFTQFMKITLPYMLAVTTPYLITQFIGNINNFNVIYLLTGGGPLSLDYFQAGHTDLLVTWLYKLTLTEKNYALASTIGIIIFVISATLSLVVFRKFTQDDKEATFQ